MVKKIYKYISEYKMLDDIHNLVVGLSGGADSVCLISVLSVIARDYIEEIGHEIHITAVHVNHGIRGEEAQRDEAFAKRIAESMGIELVCFNLEIPKMAKQEGISQESAGRIARYRCFRQVAADRGMTDYRIAVAHHMDDQAETVLMHIIRGSGMAGLNGMRAVSGDIIRPLLCVTREEILSYLKDNGLSYVTDSTNLDNEYTRNMVRNCLIPSMEKLNPQLKTALNNLAKDSSECWDYVQRQVDEAARRYLVKGDGIALIYFAAVGSNVSGCESVCEPECESDCEPVILRELIKRAYCHVHGDIVNLYRCHIDAVCGLKDCNTGKRVNLPGQITAIRNDDSILICSDGYMADMAKKQAVGVQSVEIPLKDSNHGCVELPEGVYGGFATVKWRVIDRKDFENFENNDYTKYFDYDIIKNNPVFRFRKTGDRCRIDNYGHEKRLKQELIDRKIPVRMRDTVLLLASGQKVYWAVGVRRFEEFYVTDKTDRILEISVS